MPHAPILLTTLLFSIASNGPPNEAVEDTHDRPSIFDALGVWQAPPQPAHVQYPLAAQFIPAHPSNYVAGGMQDYRYVIIHQQDGYYDGTISWFQYAGSNVSTHYVMRASDGEITQMVHNEDMGQHIGGYNPFSFGIEHEGKIYEPGWYTWETYVASAQLTRWLCDHFDIPIDREHIVGHIEVPGASHTDPGPYWNWDMYMAMVNDVIPEGRVEGVVVDRTRACTIESTADTWMTTTLEALDALDEDETCFLPAGTQLQYLHASHEMISQRRITVDDEGPCNGMGTQSAEAYIWMPSFTAPCDPQDLAPTEDVVVLLDGVEAPVDAAGRFVFEGIPEGPHMLDVVTGNGYAQTSVPIDVDVYPGTRVVVALDPIDGATSGGSTTTSGGTSPPTSSSESGEVGESDDGGTDGSSTTSGIDATLGGRPEGDTSGCGCRPTGSGGASAIALLLLGLGRRRQRFAQ